MSDWTTSPEQIADLLRWLCQEGHITTLDEAIRVVEKPWHWQHEFNLMVREFNLMVRDLETHP